MNTIREAVITEPLRVIVDAGVERFRVFTVAADGSVVDRRVLCSCNGLPDSSVPLLADPSVPLYVTGRFAGLLCGQWRHGRQLPALAVTWSALAGLAGGLSAGLIELSASGYTIIGVDKDGRLKDDLLVTHPRCGAGVGFNIDRVLLKLGFQREQVDSLLFSYLGDGGAVLRRQLPVRADRCGVFAASATISDKNQGIPLSYALAVTLKSEVVKACCHMKEPFDTVRLSGGVFEWEFCRDCAGDYLRDGGSMRVVHDRDDLLTLQGVLHLLEKGDVPLRVVLPEVKPEPLQQHPSFSLVYARLSGLRRFRRLDGGSIDGVFSGGEPVLLAIDAGSTMAKVVVADAAGKRVLYKGAFTNSCDTLETVKAVFACLQGQGVSRLDLLMLGLTGSARYQLRKALFATYPELAGRIMVLVENYAHARGSVAVARAHLAELRRAGFSGVNEEECLVVDVGGEDTKISRIGLVSGELFDNAMNSKCSAGTGSLLDSLAALFGIGDIGTAAAMAMHAERAYALNATCAVFLLEDARLLQAQGHAIPEIFASSVWAVVENMSRTLWNQIALPSRTMVLLHGQTMLSDPLPLAVAERLQQLCGGEAYCVVPPDPGHRACFGLIATMVSAPEAAGAPVALPLARFLGKQFEKTIVECRGAACGDPAARCSRTRLSGTDSEGERLSFLLGGCSAVNELGSDRAAGSRTRVSRDLYGDIWSFYASRLPVSTDENRLVIPRSFAVSEWALFFAELFLSSGIPVHADRVVEDDIRSGRACFHIDTCAPHIGAVGQMLRLAEQPHGMILAPQIEFLPLRGESLGRTCTINQGGPAVARGIAHSAVPGSRIHLFYVDMKMKSPEMLAHKLYGKLRPVYEYYGVVPDFAEFVERVRRGLRLSDELRSETADFAVASARRIIAEGGDIALVLGREYVLNPGVFDSHVGRLLRDKGLGGIPAWLLDVDADPAFSYLYWRNAHQIASFAAAAAKNEVEKVVLHSGMQAFLRERKKVRSGFLPVVQVSTFLCGPDSVTNPLVEELVKERPFLRIQSDAAIKELAHLENRMSTYVRQLADSGRVTFVAEKDVFDVALLQSLVHAETPDPETDVIAFPTLSDNRMLLSVLRGAGFACIENYSPDYRLTEAIGRGRGVAGDSVCAPMAAVYGDVLSLIETFRERRLTDAAFAGKKRLLIFNNKGLGPCRQGQYVEIHKLFLHQHGQGTESAGVEERAFVRFLVSQENKGFNAAFPQWVFLRSIQSVVLQGVLHQLWADGLARCLSNDDAERFQEAFDGLKRNLNAVLERSKPSAAALRMISRYGDAPGIGIGIKFFAYGFHRNGLVPYLRQFREEWCSRPKAMKIARIHIDGEVYMRTALFENLHREISSAVGFGNVDITCTPVWSFLEYKVAGMIMRAREAINESREEIARSADKAFQKKRQAFLRKKQKRLLVLRVVEGALRKILAEPLYRASGLAMPELMSAVLEKAKPVVSTLRPGGELMPFIGEAVVKLEEGYDLVLNVAPEGCMVSTMGEALGNSIMRASPEANGKVLPLFSQQGDISCEQLEKALLTAFGPEFLMRGVAGGTKKE